MSKASKAIKLTDPKELQAAKDYLELSKKLNEHVMFLTKKHEKEMEEVGVAFRKLFREKFVTVTHKHLKDPESAFESQTHLILRNSLEPDKDLYLISRADWNAEGEAEVHQPVDHTDLMAEKVLH